MVGEEINVRGIARDFSGGRWHLGKLRRSAGHDEDTFAETERLHRIMGDEQNGTPA